jgi:hypothetical protein
MLSMSSELGKIDLSEYKASVLLLCSQLANDACRQCYCVCNITLLRNTLLTAKLICAGVILYEHVLADRDGFIPEHLAKSSVTLMPLVSHYLKQTGCRTREPVLYARYLNVAQPGVRPQSLHKV